MHKQSYFHYTAFALLMLSLLPWFSNYIAQVVNVDIAYLTLSAGRLLNGEMMSSAYYDTNPPLSIIVQIPPALLSKITPIPLYYSISIYIFTLLTLSTVATYFLLKKTPDISANQRWLMIAAFITANTVMAGYDFGQKDHILAIALIPLVLMQILITMDIKVNSILKWSVLLAGGLLILLKPHYGLVPAAIFLHRMIYQRRINIFKDPDFLCLTAMAIAYISIIYIFFEDFITVILPDIIIFYATDISSDIVALGAATAILPIICAAISLFIFKDLSKIIPSLFLISTLCIIPFIMQGKGWLYQLLPAGIIFTTAFIILFERFMRCILSDFKTASLPLTFLSIISMAIYGGITPPNKPSHKEYKALEFTKIINECTDNCSFLILHDMINMPHELSIYTGQPHASRFPIMWFAPLLINAQDALDNGKTPLLTQKEIDKYTLKYTNMIAQDFRKYNPDIIFIGNFPSPTEDGKLFNFRDYLLENNPKFKNIWNNYNFERTISIDRIEYMGQKKPNEKLINYDIYRKKSEVKTNEQSKK